MALGEIARGAGIVFLGTMAGNALRYVFQVLAARGLGAERFGLFVLGLTVFTLFETAALIGLPQGVLRFAALHHGANEPGRVKGAIRTSLRLAAASGAAWGLALAALAPLLAAILGRRRGLVPVLIVFASLLPFSAATTVLLAGLQALRAIRAKIVAGEIVEPSARAAGAAAALVSGWGRSGVLGAYAAGTLLSFGAAWRSLRRAFPPIAGPSAVDPELRRTILSYSWPFVFVQIVNFLVLNMDTIVLGLVKTPADVGVYGAAQKTALLCSVVLLSFNALLAPVVADFYHRRKLSDVEHVYQIVSQWSLTFTLPAGLLVIGLARPVLGLFGPSFPAGAPALRIAAFGWIVHSILGSSSTILAMSGRSRLNLVNAAVILPFNIGLAIVLIRGWGLAGAALATSLSLVGIDGLASAEVFRLEGWHPFRTGDLKPLAAGAAAIAIMSGGSALFRFKPVSAGEIGLFVLVWLGLYFIMMAILPDSSLDRALLTRIFPNMRTRR